MGTKLQLMHPLLDIRVGRSDRRPGTSFWRAAGGFVGPVSFLAILLPCVVRLANRSRRITEGVAG